MERDGVTFVDACGGPITIDLLGYVVCVAVAGAPHLPVLRTLLLVLNHNRITVDNRDASRVGIEPVVKGIPRHGG